MRRSAGELLVDFAELSDPGRDPSKCVNEDASGFTETPLGLLSVVCDGMGGHVGGQEASHTAVRIILEHGRSAHAGQSPSEMLRVAVRDAGRAVHAIGGVAHDATRPGSTCVATLLSASGATVAHVGDSRLMLIRSGQLRRLTRDHSLVQELVAAGKLTEAQAAEHPDANQITRALGMTADVDVEVCPAPVELRVGDVLLLTSDGVTDLLGDSDLLHEVSTNLGRGTAAVCHRLVQLANSRGGYDNLTVQVLHVLEVPAVPHGVAPTHLDPVATVLLDDDAVATLGGPRTERIASVSSSANRGPRPTVPDRSVWHPTVVDPTPGAAPATVLLEPASGTAVADPIRRAHRTAPSPHPSVPAGSGLSVAARRRAWITVIALAAFVAAGSFVAWWGRQSRWQTADDPLPATATTDLAPAPTATAETLQLVPEPSDTALEMTPRWPRPGPRPGPRTGPPPPPDAAPPPLPQPSDSGLP